MRSSTAAKSSFSFDETATDLTNKCLISNVFKVIVSLFIKFVIFKAPFGS